MPMRRGRRRREKCLLSADRACVVKLQPRIDALRVIEMAAGQVSAPGNKIKPPPFSHGKTTKGSSGVPESVRGCEHFLADEALLADLQRGGGAHRQLSGRHHKRNVAERPFQRLWEEEGGYRGQQLRRDLASFVAGQCNVNHTTH